MHKKINFRNFGFYFVMIFFIFSCMDPVIDTDDSYSDFLEIDASEYLNNPNEGFTNGGFEDGLAFWGGNRDQFNNDVQNIGIVEIDTADTIVQAIEGNKCLKLTSQSGAVGIYRYFEYTPGDTIEYTFSYYVRTPAQNIRNSPAFNLQVFLTATDNDANFLEFSDTYYSIGNVDPNLEIYADNEWHTVTATFTNNSLEAVGNYLQVRIGEWSNWDWDYDYPRSISVLLDDFKVEVKKSKNSKPSDFSILHPVSGDAFNLDTIVNFQTIPFSWEPSTDSDTVSYTNRLVCKVVCDGALISKGFESFSMNEVWDPVLEQQITRKMPQGYGLFASNWGSLQTFNNLTHQYVNSSVVDSVARTGMHSLKMEDVESNDAVYHHSTLIYRLSEVNNNFNKDRIRPGSELTIRGYMMTPSSDKISGENHAELIIYSYTDLWNISTSQVINKNYSPDIWHPFEVTVVVPEHRAWPNTATVYAGFRYSQFAGGSGSVYFDDVTISTSDPMTFFVTDYYDVLTSNTSTIMSASYLKNLFSYIVDDLSGITFSQVDFEWGLIATDQNHEVMATNSPITFTVIDSTFNDIDNTMMQIGPDVQDMDFNSLNEILGAK